MTKTSTAAEQHRLLDEARARKLDKPPDRQAEARRDILLYGNRLFPGFPPATGRQALTVAIAGVLILAAIIVAIAI